jgi:acetylornithine/succinyldiaminopimelate/putrescine aminotransferase
MNQLSHKPELGHITTFGGNPVIAAAALATLQKVSLPSLLLPTMEHERLVRALLRHRLIREIRGRGLMLCIICERAEVADFLVQEAAKRRLILFWLLFEKRAVRITPPLTISKPQLMKGCQQILEVLDSFGELHTS